MITRLSIFSMVLFSVNLVGMNENSLSIKEKEVVQQTYKALNIFNEMNNTLLNTSEEWRFFTAVGLVDANHPESKEVSALCKSVMSSLREKRNWIYSFFMKESREYQKELWAIPSLFHENKLLANACTEIFRQQSKQAFFSDKPMSYEVYERAVCKSYKPQLQEKTLAIK